jgi:hypothetical protein
MITQAKAHFESGYAQSGKGPLDVSGVICSGRINVGEPGQVEIALGSRLMQDVGLVVQGQAPFAYPKRLYRWARQPESADLSFNPISPIHGQLLDELNKILEDEHEWPGRDFASRRHDFRASIEAVGDRIDKVLLLQLLEMMSQVESHYREAEPGLGVCLLMDIRRILGGMSAPFSYPGKWRWPKSR